MTQPQVAGIVAWRAKCSKMLVAAMNRSQRVVLIVYCLLLTYCCVWIPWRVKYHWQVTRYERVGYGWLWSGPRVLVDEVVPAGDIFDQVDVLAEVDLSNSPAGEVDRAIRSVPRPQITALVMLPKPIVPSKVTIRKVLQTGMTDAEPDGRLILLRFAAATAIAAALFLLAGTLWKSPPS